ncbi:MAG: hypothetical protein DRI84_04360 [Bacteroidetes bacterium]|nr:MAG: hypothetical protein DRI84_04360 [Bacteroidota bacterium]
MAKIILMPSRLKIRRQSVKWIIIHHTAEMYDNPEARIDNTKYQLPGIFKGVLEKKQGDVNYNYVVEKVKEDYIAIATRPTPYLCEWPDIDNVINDRAVHVALLGNYDLKIPQKRLYDILAYRVLNPMMKIYNLSPKRIKLHKDVSNDDDIYCPGEFVDYGRIITATRRFVIK